MEMNQQQERKFLLLWWGGLAIFLLFFHSNHVLNNQEGIVLGGAWNMISGKELYVDFFENIAPGSFYLLAFFWNIFGSKYWIANSIGMAAVYLGALGIYKISRRFSKDRLNSLLPLFYILASIHWPIISHSSLGNFFVIWGSFFFLKGLQKGRAANFIVSGLFFGFSALFLQHKGVGIIVVMIGFLLALWIVRKRSFWKKAVAMFAVFSILPLFSLFHWPPSIIHSSLVDCCCLQTIFPSLTIFFLAFLMFAVLNAKRLSLELAFIVILQLFLLVFTFLHPANYNVALAIFPLIAIIPYANKEIFSGGIIQKMIFLIFIAISAWMLLRPSFGHLAAFPPLYSTKEHDPISYIQQNCPGKNGLYAGPFLPGIYYETGKNNPTPFPWLMNRCHTAGHFKKAKRELEKAQPKCVVMNYSAAREFGYSQDNQLDEYIRKNYYLTRNGKGFQIFERK